MTTFGQLVGKVRQQLLGYTANQESVAELDGAMLSSDTSFVCATDTIDAIGRGLVEIDDELILVRVADSTSGTVTVMGGTNGRGAEGTTAASHASGALVTASPTFPRGRIKEAINDTILGLYPSLVVFASTEITYNAAQVEYELPAAATDVWYVTARLVGPEKVSQPMPDWRYNPQAQTDDHATGKSIQILNSVTPGQTVKVVYAKPPSALSSDADDFAAVTGFPDRITDLVVFGAVKRTLPALAVARLQMQAIEATDRSTAVSSRDIVSAVQTYATLYAERLEEERSRMFAEVPTYATFQGS